MPGAAACRREVRPAPLEHLWFWPGLKEVRATPAFPARWTRVLACQGKAGRVVPVPSLGPSRGPPCALQPDWRGELKSGTQHPAYTLDRLRTSHIRLCHVTGQ